MSAKLTEQKLIRAIAQHNLDDGESKLTINEVSKQVGISRQAFNRTYKHLKPYVTGERPIEEILKGCDEDESHGLLSKSQHRIRELKEEIEQLKKSSIKEAESIRGSYITTLMNNDITMRESDEIRIRIEKQALQNDILVQAKSKLEQDVTLLTARLLSDNGKTPKINAPVTEIIPIEPNLDPVFSNYLKTGDVDIFEDEKDVAVEMVLKRVNKFCCTEDSRVVIFIERYLSSFTKFVNNYQSSSTGSVIIIKLPLFSRAELKMFAAKIKPCRPIEIHVPFCDTESICKAQRKFSFREIPEIERDAADSMVLPVIQDGFESVTIFRVHQGD